MTPHQSTKPAKYFIGLIVLCSIWSISDFSHDKKAYKDCELGNAQSKYVYNSTRAVCVKVR